MPIRHINPYLRFAPKTKKKKSYFIGYFDWKWIVDFFSIETQKCVFRSKHPQMFTMHNDVNGAIHGFNENYLVLIYSNKLVSFAVAWHLLCQNIQHFWPYPELNTKFSNEQSKWDFSRRHMPHEQHSELIILWCRIEIQTRILYHFT